MCLVLKLDNGKVVSIVNGQTHRVTQPPSTVLVYRYRSIINLNPAYFIKTWNYENYISLYVTPGGNRNFQEVISLIVLFIV